MPSDPATRTGFQSIRDEVLRRLETGHWQQGALLPTEAELAEEFGAARATVNRALRELADRGLIERRRKSGTRVAAAPTRRAEFEIAIVRKEVEAMNASYRYALVQREEIPAPGWLSAQLALPDGAPVVHVQAMHYADARPFQFEERWINIAAVPQVRSEPFDASGPNEWLLARVPFTNAEVSIHATQADESVAAYLDAPVGAALLRMDRTTWLRGTPVTFVTMIFHPGYRMQTRY